VFSSTMQLSMPSAVSAASRCSTVSTETGFTREPRGEPDAAEVRDGRRESRARRGPSAETDAVVGRRGLQRQRDLVAGMQADSGTGDGTAESALRIHDLYWGWVSHFELSKRAAMRQLPRFIAVNC
jgi:hypothetical protein